MVERKRVQKFFTKPSLTRQEFKDSCDLSLILKRFSQTPEGLAALRNASGFAEGAQFADVTGVPDYRASLDANNAAKASFEALPLNVRKRFDNDPVQLLDFVSRVENRDEARALGLLRPLDETQVVNPESLK